MGIVGGLIMHLTQTFTDRWLLRLLLLVVFVLMSGCTPLKSRTIEDSVLDLRDWSPDEDPILLLNGTWEFYPDVLLNPDDAPPFEPVLLEAPDTWTEPVGKGTYRVSIRLPAQSRPYRLEFISVAGASQAWIDDTPLPPAGTITERLEDTREDLKGTGLTFVPTGETIIVNLQVTNYHFRYGGLFKSVLIGVPDVLQLRTQRSLLLTALSSVTLMTMGGGFIVLFAYRPRDWEHVYFGLFCILTACRNAVVGEGDLLREVLPNISWFTIIRVEYVTLPAGTLIGIGLIAAFSGIAQNSRLVRTFQVISAALSVLTFALPLQHFGSLLPILQIWLLITLFVCIGILTHGAWRNHGAARPMLILSGLGSSMVIHDVLLAEQVSQSSSYIGAYGVLLFCLGQGVLLIRTFAASITRNERLSAELKRTHQSVLRFVPVTFLRLLGRRPIVEIRR